MTFGQHIYARHVYGIQAIQSCVISDLGWISVMTDVAHQVDACIIVILVDCVGGAALDSFR